MIKAVLDTNILFSAIFWKGNPYQAVKKALRKEYILMISKPILDELRKVLEEIKWPEKNIIRWEQLILRNSILVQPQISLNVIKEDPADNKFLECALTANADYIVSGNTHLLKIKKYQKVEIIKVKNFLNKLKEFKKLEGGV